jgi:hypothetical protein
MTHYSRRWTGSHGRRWVRVPVGAVLIAAATTTAVLTYAPLTSADPITQTVVSSATNSLCLNPSGVTSISGPQSTSLTSPTCNPPAALASLSGPVLVTTIPGNFGSISGGSWVGISHYASDLSDYPYNPQWATNSPVFDIYDADFSLPCFTTASLSGSMLADGAVGVYLNNSFIAAQPVAPSPGGIPPSSNYSGLATTFATSVGFTPGMNVLDFIVADYGQDQTGLDFSATITYVPCVTTTTTTTTVASSTTTTTTVPPAPPTSMPVARFTG